MAVAFVASGTALDTVTTALALVAPATNPDDILIANISSLDNGVVTAPQGWNKVFTRTNTGVQQQNVFWYRTADGDSGGTFTFGVAGTTASYGVILQYRGATIQGSPVNSNAASSANASSANITFPAISNIRSGRSLIVALGVYSGTGTAAGVIAGTNPTFTNREIDNDAVNATEALVAYDGLSVNGANVATGRTDATGASTGISIGSYLELIDPLDEGALSGAGGGGQFYAYGVFSRQRPMPGYTRNS